MSPLPKPGKQTVRKFEPARPPGQHPNWDEQLWPVNLGLVVLAGAAAAIVATHGDFQARTPWQNGWLHLGVLGAIMAVLAWGMARLEGRVHRRVQLGVLFSLLVHVGLCLLTYHVYLGIAARQETETELALDDPQIVTLPEYRWQQDLDQVVQDESLEAPIETEIPDTEPLDIDRTQTDTMPAERQPDQESAAAELTPADVAIERAELAAPHRSERLAGSEISRQELEAPQPVEDVPMPQIEQAAERSGELDDRVQVDQRRAELAIERPDAGQEAPAASARRPAPAVERLQGSLEPRLPDSVRPANRRSAAPAEATATRVDRPEPAPAAVEPRVTRPEPSVDTLARRAASAPERSAPVDMGDSSANSQSQPFEPRRAVEAPAPSTQARTDQRSARAPSRAAANAARIEIEAPATAESTADPATARPAPTAIARAGDGAAGVTRQDNLDREPAGGESRRAAIASAARRAQASRQDEADESDSASMPARIARARAGADLPSATLSAEEVTLPDAAGARRTSPVEASTSAAVERRASSAPAGRVTAETGSAQVDTGLPQIASPVAAGGSPGDGEPTISVADSSPRLARAAGPAEAASDAAVPLEAPGGAAPGSTSQPGATEPAADGPAVGELERAAAAAPAGSRPAGSAAPDNASTGVAGISIGPRRVDTDADPAGSIGGSPALSRAPSAADANADAVEVASTGAAGQPGPTDPDGNPLTASGTAEGAEIAEPGGPASDDRTRAQRRSGGLPARIVAPAGPGGLAKDTPGSLGVPSRRARPESPLVQTDLGRLILERSGSTPAAEVRVQDAAVPGLKQRDRLAREQLARQRGGSAGSELAVERGLEFLARHQSPDGSWSLENFGQGKPGYQNAGAGEMQSNTAATGLALLAFLGAGYTHTDGKYRDVVARGVNNLLANQRDDGDLFVPQDEQSNRNVWLYSHGIASIALCEAYGMTRDPLLEGPAQRSLDFIVWAQSPSEGGWRYYPRQGSDTSVSGWQLMALKSGELAGLAVSAECYQRVERWLDGAQAPSNRSLYAYRPRSEQRHQREPSRVMTAEALLMRQYLGWKRDNPYMLAGADYLRRNLPQWEGGGRQRDCYYWYYATQVMFQMGSDHWRDWNARLRPILTESQVSSGPLAGSWDPAGSSADRWGREGGRIYVTAMHLLILEVYYRHLPLYRNLQDEEQG